MKLDISPTDVLTFFKDQRMHKYTKIFGEFGDISDLVRTIENKNGIYDFDERFSAHNALVYNIFKLDHLNPLEKKIVRENNKKTIRFHSELKKSFLPLTRESGHPNVVHSLSVGYILSVAKAPVYSIIAGVNHDNAEDKIDMKKNHMKFRLVEPKKEVMDRMTSKIICEQCDSLKQILDDVTPASYRPKLIKTLAISCIIQNKVTRFESDKHYYASIDRIFDKNISENEPSLTAFFKKYALMTGEKLEFDEKEKHEIIQAAASVKLADRIANTIEIFTPKEDMTKEEASFKNMKNLYKNLYLLNQVNNYILDIKENNPSMELNPSYKIIKELREVLLYSHKRLIEHELQDVDDYILSNEKKEINRAVNEYKTKGGFERVDYGFDEDLFSGFFRRTWDRNLKGTFKGKPDNKYLFGREKYMTLIAIKEITKNFLRKENYTLPGLDSLGKEKKVEWIDDMGEKYNDPDWYKKKQIREEYGVSTFESFYENKAAVEKALLNM